jgi:cytidyltransferase-like protein
MLTESNLNKKIVICTGGFDPLHSGHIEYLKAAKVLGDILLVGVNSDEWLIRKKGAAFMPLKERLTIIDSLKFVDGTLPFDDTDNSACDMINQVKSRYPLSDIIFANGGDRNEGNIPENKIKGIKFIFGVGGDTKKNSSSSILATYREAKCIRPWGDYRVLYEAEGVKVKILGVEPGQSLTMQRHLFRDEYWRVSEGLCMVEVGAAGKETHQKLSKQDHITIPEKVWHRLYNPFDKVCSIVEIQYGKFCEESDIERR